MEDHTEISAKDCQDVEMVDKFLTGMTMREIKKLAVLLTLKSTGYNLSKTARNLKISLKGLRLFMDSNDIHRSHRRVSKQ